MAYTVQPERWQRGAALRIYGRQLSLGLLWSGIIVGVLWLLTLARGDRFDGPLAVTAVVSMAGLQVRWSSTHIRNIRRLAAQCDVQDYLLSPARDVRFPNRNAQWINTLLVGGMPSDLKVEVHAKGPGAYLVRQGPPARARVHILVDLSGDAPVAHIRGHIPWWVGVDYGYCHKVVLAVREYLLKNGAVDGSTS